MERAIQDGAESKSIRRDEVFDILNQTTNRLITKKIEFSKGEYFVNSVPSEIHQALLNLGINSTEAFEECLF